MPTRARAATLLTLSVLLFSGIARSDEPGFTMKISVPFGFTLGDSKFSAGEYEIVRQVPNLLLVKDAKGRVLSTALTKSVDAAIAPTLSKLTFHKHGKHYVLAQVWLADNRTGQEIYHVLGPTRAAQNQVTVPLWFLQWSQDHHVKGLR